MGDSYYPNRRGSNEHYRDRGYMDYDSSSYPSNGRRGRDSRSRSPPRRLSYDDGPQDDDDGVGFRIKGQSQAQSYNNSSDVNASDIYRYKQPGAYRNPAPSEPRGRDNMLHGGPPRMMPSAYYGQASYRGPPGVYQNAARYEPRGREILYGGPPGAMPPVYRGEKDIATDGEPHRFVLVRGLKEATTETSFAKGMVKLYREGSLTSTPSEEKGDGATPNSIHRVILIRNRETNVSMGYGFVEYFGYKDAQAAVEKAQLLEDNMTIASKKVQIDFPHGGVFPHHDADLKPESNKTYLIKIQGSSRLHKYWFTQYYASEWKVNEHSPDTVRGLFKETGTQETAAPAKKMKTESVMQTLDSEPLSRKRKAPGLVAPAMVDYFNKKQHELREGEQAVTSQSGPEHQPATGVNAITFDASTTPTGTTQREQTFCYQSAEVIGCYLCGAVFQKLENIFLHLRESEKHASNAKDEEKRAQGLQRLKKKGINPDRTIQLPRLDVAAVPEDAAPTQHYRDRAKERREEESKTAAPQKVKMSLKKPTKAGRSASSSDNETATGKTQPSYGKGMGLLQKAGWSAGQGLGAVGAEGRADVIEQTLYTSGVGLGHESSKLGDAGEAADRATKGEGYAERGRDVMAARFRQM